MTRSLLLAALLALPVAAGAQEGPRFAFTLGAGVQSVPDYFGSSDSTVAPALTFDLGYLSLGPLSFGNPDLDAVAQGFGFRGSFRYVPERSVEDHPELAGTEDLDAAIEIGGGLRYARPWWEVFAVARYGVTGHEAVVGEVGMDLIARPTDRLELRAGPRLSLGSGDFASDYFDYAPTGYEAEGGHLASGVEVGATYRFTDAWGVEATARYDHLQQDAADSPITEEDDQFSATVAVTRRFDFRF